VHVRQRHRPHLGAVRRLRRHCRQQRQPLRLHRLADAPALRTELHRQRRRTEPGDRYELLSRHARRLLPGGRAFEQPPVGRRFQRWPKLRRPPVRERRAARARWIAGCAELRRQPGRHDHRPDHVAGVGSQRVRRVRHQSALRLRLAGSPAGGGRGQSGQLPRPHRLAPAEPRGTGVSGQPRDLVASALSGQPLRFGDGEPLLLELDAVHAQSQPRVGRGFFRRQLRRRHLGLGFCGSCATQC
jgi:hypothetical protein